MRDAGRRLGGAPSGAAPITAFAKGGTCPAVAAGPPHRRFCLGLPGPAHQPGSCTSWCKLRLYRQFIETEANLRHSSALSSDRAPCVFLCFG